jgi:hypothetical protein
MSNENSSTTGHGTVYLLTFPNGKKYVGITVQPLIRRMYSHRREAASKRVNWPLYSAWRKYGEPAVSILAEVANDVLKDTEIRLIRELCTLVPGGYNVSPGGQLGRLGLPHLPETCAKMSAAWRAHYDVPENYARLVETRRRTYRENPELRSRLSDLAKIRFADPEQHAALTKRIRQQMAAPEIRERLSQSAKKRMQDPEERRRISESLTGMKATPETRAKMSESHKRRYVEGAIHPKPMLGKKMSAEARAKISAARKKFLSDPENLAALTNSIRASKAAQRLARLKPTGESSDFTD